MPNTTSQLYLCLPRASLVPEYVCTPSGSQLFPSVIPCYGCPATHAHEAPFHLATVCVTAPEAADKLSAQQ